MARRARLGVRPDGVRGMFVSPPGVDAATAPLSSLLLHASMFADQIIMRGLASPGAFIPLNLGGQIPILWINPRPAPNAAIYGSGGPTFALNNIMARPWPYYNNSGDASNPFITNMTASISGSGITISTGLGAYLVNYVVYRRRAM